jgi:RNA polymerase sigma-70 factor (ECF subfamily)
MSCLTPCLTQDGTLLMSRQPLLEPAIETEDMRLVRLAKATDHAAFVELHRKYSRLAMAVIFRIMKNQEDTEDVLQDTFVRVFTHIHSFDGRSKFSTWLTRIAINTSLMHLRRRKSRPECSLEMNHEGEAEMLMDIADPAPDPEMSCIHNDALSEVRRAVQRLPCSLRETIALRCSQGLAVRDIAETTGVSLAAAKSRLMRANTAVRTMLEANGQAPFYKSNRSRQASATRR